MCWTASIVPCWLKITRPSGNCLCFHCQVTPCSSLVLQKLVVPTVVKKFPESYWTVRFIVHYRVHESPPLVHILTHTPILRLVRSSLIIFYVVCTVHHIAMCRWTNKMHNFLQIIFIFPCFALHVSDVLSVHHQGAPSSKLYHAFGTFVQASLTATWL